MPISGWFMVYNEREWSGDRRRMCISRHRQLCVLFVFIFIILRGVIILLVLRRHSSNMCCFVFHYLYHYNIVRFTKDERKTN